MSQDTWNVVIYGVEVTGIELNQATKDLFGGLIDTVNEEVLMKVLDSHSYLTWSSSGGDGEVFIGITPQYPWEIVKEQELLSVTTEDVKEEVNRIINEIAAEPITLELDYVSTTGWG